MSASPKLSQRRPHGDRATDGIRRGLVEDHFVLSGIGVDEAIDEQPEPSTIGLAAVAPLS
jgi:hypothetical protein